MMGQTQRADSSISTSSLSPLAVPFNFGRTNNQFSSNSASGVVQDPCLSPLAVPFNLDNLDYHYDIPVGSQQETGFSHYPPVEFENFHDYDLGDASNSDLLTLNEVSLPTYTHSFGNLGFAECFGKGLLYGKKEKMTVDCRGSFFRKENNAGGTVSSESLLEGNHVAGGLNSCQNSNCIPGKSAGILLGKDALMSQDQEQKDFVSRPYLKSGCQGTPDKFLTPFVDSSAGKFKSISETQMSYPPGVVSGRKYALDVSPDNGPLLQSDSDICDHVFCPPDRPPPSVISGGTSSICPSRLLLNSYSFKKADIADKCTINDVDNSCHNASGVEILHIGKKTKREEIDEKKSMIDDGNEENLLQSKSDSGTDKPLENSNIHNNCCTDLHSNETRFAVEKSSSILDHNDSDLDSPCWKGKGIETSGSLFQNFEPGQSQQKKKEKAVLLNPLAPHFLPSSVEGRKNSGNDIVQDGFSSFLVNSPYHTNFSFGELEPLTAADAEPYPFDLKQIRTEYVKDSDDRGKAFPVDNGKKQSSISNTSNEKILNARSVENSVKENQEDVQVKPTVKFSAANIRRTPERQPYLPPADFNLSEIYKNAATDDGIFLNDGSSSNNCVVDSSEKHFAALTVPYGSSGRCQPRLSYENLVNNKEDYSCDVSLSKDFQMESSNKKVIDEGKSFKNEINEKDECESKCGSGMEKSAANNSIPNYCIQETCSNKASICVNTTSKILGDSGSDSFNSHRKGKAAAPLPWEVSGPGQWELQKKEKSDRLNPLAPHFVPAANGGNSYLGSEHPKDGFSTFQIISTPSPMSISFQEHGLSKNKMKENSYELNGIRIEYSRDNHDREKETKIQHSRDDHVREKMSSVYIDEKKRSLLNSSGRSQPTSLNGFSIFDKKPANVRCIGDSLQGMEEALQVEPTMASSIATNETLNSSLSGTGSIGDLIEKLLVVSNSMSSYSNVDIQKVIRAMGVLSELLVRNYSHGSDLHSESQSDIVQLIINNLSVFWKNHCGQLDVMPESVHTSSQYDLDKSTAPQCSNMGLGDASFVVVPGEPPSENDRKVYEIHSSHVSLDNRQDSFSSCSIWGAATSNEIVPVIREGIGRGLKVAEDNKMQAFVFRNLWLDKEAEMCMRKYETYLWRMKGGMADEN